jgi:hypothetical protein
MKSIQSESDVYSQKKYNYGKLLGTSTTTVASSCWTGCCSTMDESVLNLGTACSSSEYGYGCASDRQIGNFSANRMKGWSRY